MGLLSAMGSLLEWVGEGVNKSNAFNLGLFFGFGLYIKVILRF